MTIDARERSTCDSRPFECYWFSCGSKSWYYAAGDKLRVLNGITYTPETIERTAIDFDQELKAGSVKVTVPIDNEVAQLFTSGYPPLPINVVIYGGQDGDSEYGAILTGIVKGIENNGNCEFNVVTEKDALNQMVPGLVFQPACVHQIFQAGCGLSKIAWQTLGVIADISTDGKTVTIAAAATQTDGHFVGGYLEAHGTSKMIVSHVGSTIGLSHHLQGLNIGDSVTLVPGCDGSETRCRFFGNILNHLGFSKLPDTNPFGEGGIS